MKLSLLMLKDNSGSRWDSYASDDVIISDTNVNSYLRVFAGETKTRRELMYLAIKCVLDGFHLPIIDCDSEAKLDSSMQWIRRQRLYHPEDIGVIESSPKHYWVMLNWPRLRQADALSEFMTPCPGNDTKYVEMCKQRGFATLRGTLRENENGSAFMPKWVDRPKQVPLRAGQRDMLAFGDAIIEHFSTPEVEAVFRLDHSDHQYDGRHLDEFVNQIAEARSGQDVWDEI